MHQEVTLYKIAFLNVLLAILLLVWAEPLPHLMIRIALCLMNAGFIAIVLYNLPKFLKRNNERLLLGRKRTLIVLMCSIYIFLITFAQYYPISERNLFITYLAWTVLISIIYLFASPISVFLHKIFKKRRRIAVVGYDDNANRLAERLRKKSNSQFISHLN